MNPYLYLDSLIAGMEPPTIAVQKSELELLRTFMRAELQRKIPAADIGTIKNALIAAYEDCPGWAGMVKDALTALQGMEPK